jgi:hypothetical protein
MAYTTQHLKNQAALLARKPAANNPLKNPGAWSQYSAPQQQLIAAIANHPVAGPMALASPTPAAAGATPNTRGDEPLEGHQLTRSATTRHNLVGFQTATLTPGGGIQAISAVPQNPFTASRCIISAVTLGLWNGYGTTIPATTIANWKVGAKSQFASIGAEPVGLLAASLGGGRLRFSKCPAAIAITAQVNAVAATAAFYACMVGTAGKRKSNDRPPPQYAKEDRVAIPPTVVAPGGTGSIVVNPTRKFWPTYVFLDDTGAGTFGLQPGPGGSSFCFPDILVGSDSQLMTAPSQAGQGIPYIPGGIFNGLHAVALDWDMVPPAVGLTFEYFNAGSVTATLSGVVLGDVDKRNDVESDDPDVESQY